MGRSAVIRSLDREHLCKVSASYPLEGVIKADHKRFTVMLHQCNLLSLLGTLQLQVQEQTHAHTHTHTSQLGWILPQDGFAASPLLYVKHGLVVAHTCLGYGSGMHRVWHGVWNEKHDFS